MDLGLVNGLHFFKTIVDGIQLRLDASDGFQGGLRLRHDDLMEIAFVELVINGQFIGTVHDLVEVAAEPRELLLILGVEGEQFRHCFYSPSCPFVVETVDCVTDHGTRVAAVALCFLLEELQLFVVKSDFADVVSVGVVHLLIVLKLVVWKLEFTLGSFRVHGLIIFQEIIRELRPRFHPSSAGK